jgi:lysophospholipase L1-like esterase
MTAQARRVDAKLLVVHLPTVDRWSPAPADLQQAVAAAGATDTLFLVDAYPALKAFADEHGLDSIFIPNDGHPTAAGHARIAETIEPVLRKLTAR